MTLEVKYTRKISSYMEPCVDGPAKQVYPCANGRRYLKKHNVVMQMDNIPMVFIFGTMSKKYANDQTSIFLPT